MKVMDPDLPYKAFLLGSGPYAARSASNHTDDWPWWMVVRTDGSSVNGVLNVLRFKHSMQMFALRKMCEEIVKAANSDAAFGG